MAKCSLSLLKCCAILYIWTCMRSDDTYSRSLRMIEGPETFTSARPKSLPQNSTLTIVDTITKGWTIIGLADDLSQGQCKIVQMDPSGESTLFETFNNFGMSFLLSKKTSLIGLLVGEILLEQHQIYCHVQGC